MRTIIRTICRRKDRPRTGLRLYASRLRPPPRQASGHSLCQASCLTLNLRSRRLSKRRRRRRRGLLNSRATCLGPQVGRFLIMVAWSEVIKNEEVPLGIPPQHHELPHLRGADAEAEQNHLMGHVHKHSPKSVSLVVLAQGSCQLRQISRGTRRTS